MKPPKNLPKKELRFLIQRLSEVVQIATMNSANFDCNSCDPPTSFDSEHPTEYIRQKTKLWRETWIIEPLRTLIERYEEALDGE
jgi:hypothetical protein